MEWHKNAPKSGRNSHQNGHQISALSTFDFNMMGARRMGLNQ
jgi:hypothetical protein